jgi:NosR/NirI family nitrous oxide reductase transcriptional regulator
MIAAAISPLRRTILLTLLAICVLIAVPARAQQPPVDTAVPPPASSAAPDAGELPAGDDGWGFEDEEEAEPTFAELARAQALDIGLFAAYAALAMVSFFRKSEKLKIVTFVATIAYLGFRRSYLLSVTNIFALLDFNLPIFRQNLAWYTFAIFGVATTVLWGRLYSGRVCAFGALTQLMDRIVPKRLQIEVPRAIERRAAYVKYGLLAGVIVYFLVTHDNFIFRYVEPFWMFGLHGSAIMWTMLAVLLTATLFVRNLYCRFLCPVGATLGLISSLTVFRIKRWSECSTCRICEKTCEWGAIRGPQIIKSECVRCDDCERLYANEQKCPHWIIFYRKDEIAARRAARAAAAASAQFHPSQGATR